MSENQTIDSLNININAGSSGEQSIQSRFFDLGLKVIIPVVLIVALLAIVIIVRLILPLLDLGGDIITATFSTGNLVSGAVAAITSWIIGAGSRPGGVL